MIVVKPGGGNAKRSAFLTTEAILGQMCAQHGIQLDLTECAYGTIVGLVEALQFHNRQFTKEMIDMLANPDPDVPEYTEFFTWGPHAVWLDQHLEKLFNKST